MRALAVTVVPLNIHLGFYSTFRRGLTLLSAALCAGCLAGPDGASRARGGRSFPATGLPGSGTA